MGSAASKAARKLPKEKPQGWTGSRVPPGTTTARSQPEIPLPSENKNEVIESDAMDPHFMEKLNRLGPVRVVDPHMQTSTGVRAASDVQNMYRSRMRSEAEAIEAASTTAQQLPAQTRLLASSLTELLDARKSITSGAELESLAKRYHVDSKTLERLARVVSTPSVDESTVVRPMDKHGEESLTMMACWIDPALSCR